MKVSAKQIVMLIGGAFLVFFIALAAFAFFMPKDAIVAEIDTRIERATQRQFDIAGPVGFTFWPALGFTAEQVTISNPEGFGDTPFLTADKIVFAVAVVPLLSGKIEVKKLILDNAALALEAKADGAANWTFPTEDEGEDKAPTLDDLKLEDVRLNNGSLSFRGPDGDPIQLDDVDASFGLDSLDAPSKLEAAFDYRGERLDLETDITTPRALIERGETPIAVKLQSAPLEATFNGDLNVATAALTGKLDAHGASMRRLMGWVGAPLETGGAFGAFSAAGDLSHEGETTALTGGTYRLDSINARGDVRIIARESEKLRVTGAITTDQLDVNPYLPAPTQGQNAAGVDASTAWTTAPLDLSGLSAIDADLTFKIGALIFQKLRFSDVDMRLGLANGVADARLSRISLYGGQGTARLVADGRASAAKIAVELDARDVRALPLLRDAIGFESIDGKGRLVAQVAGAGASQAAIMRSLAGTASFNFNDGELKGFNLASVARTVTAILSGDAVGPASSTDFAEMSAAFRINNGVAATENLRLLNPYVRLEGAGLIDIGAQTLDMRIAPRAVNSIQGQGGDAAVSGLGVPFRVDGAWSAPRFRPALDEAVQNEIRNRAREALQRQNPDSPLGVLSTAIFGPSPPPASAAAAEEKQEAAPTQEAPAAEPEAKQEEPSTEQRVRDALGRLLKQD